MLDVRDHDFLAAVDRIGPASAHVLAFHPFSEKFSTFDALAHRLEELVAAGVLHRRELPDVVGDPEIEYETVDDWFERADLANASEES